MTLERQKLNNALLSWEWGIHCWMPRFK